MAVKFNADNKSKECFTDAPVYSVKGVKSFQGREGLGFECSLYKDGKRLGTVTDVANGGGQLQMNLKTREQETELEDYCKTLPQLSYMNDGKEKFFDSDPCIFVGGLVDKWETNKTHKRWCKKATVFRIDGDKEGQYRSISTKFDARVKAHLDKKYPDKGLYILNEHLV